MQGSGRTTAIPVLERLTPNRNPSELNPGQRRDLGQGNLGEEIWHRRDVLLISSHDLGPGCLMFDAAVHAGFVCAFVEAGEIAGYSVGEDEEVAGGY